MRRGTAQREVSDNERRALTAAGVLLLIAGIGGLYWTGRDRGRAEQELETSCIASGGTWVVTTNQRGRVSYCAPKEP